MDEDNVLNNTLSHTLRFLDVRLLSARKDAFEPSIYLSIFSFCMCLEEKKRNKIKNPSNNNAITYGRIKGQVRFGAI